MLRLAGERVGPVYITPSHFAVVTIQDFAICQHVAIVTGGSNHIDH